MHAIRIDRARSLCLEPHLGHNRYRADIAPVLEVAPGEEVIIETHDSVDGQLGPETTEAVFSSLDGGRVHPLTGPIFVKGAEPGDALEIEFLDIETQPTGFSTVIPGLRLLRDLMTTLFLVHWDIKDGWATSAQFPGVRIAGTPFMVISAVAPSHAAMNAWREREQCLLERGGFVLPPDPHQATSPVAIHGLRTHPPRENGGNFDVKQITRGAN